MHRPSGINSYIFPFKELINLTVAIGIFLLNYFLLIPELFAKKHFILYSCSVIFLIMFMIAQQVFVDYQLLNEVQDRFFADRIDRGMITDGIFRDTVMGPPPMMQPFPAEFEMPGRPWPPRRPSGFFIDIILPQTLLKSSFLAVIIFFTGGFFTAGINWLRTDVQKQEVEKRQLESELKFLKAQINPHFLFNCLNSIYVLTTKNAEQARFSIHRLSSFLRYLLRVSEVSRVPLQWETEAIEDYVSLQRTRLPKHIQLNCQIVKTGTSLVIEPMLLLPLIENVFKHGIDPENPGSITIDISIQDNQLSLVTINPVVHQSVNSPGGIGIRNIESRLAISYPDRSQLAYIKSNSEFLVKLSIRLDNELHHY